MIAAIETACYGFRFRSRLEARWSVCFTQLGVKWGYEVQDFNLPGGRYLPDFLIQQEISGLDLWVEIKGKPPTQHEILLMEELCDYSAQPGCILSGEIPYIANPSDSIEVQGYYIPPRLKAIPGPVFIRKCPACHHAFFTVDASLECFCEWDAQQEVVVAIAAARKARFEHGEVPR